MNYKMYLAFVKWCFMKMFGGTFDKLASFRYNLKQGAPDSIFAVFAFIIIAIIAMLVSMVTVVFFTDSKELALMTGSSIFWLSVATFFYNIFKAAFECFLEERQDLFDTLKRPE